ncbi:hypothetical protein HU200_033335 [Digitaria exilis]|uniref:Uncharacterized protein n=1 Tax=Digitaria exilis TaxID=1010633 RepID=A0A835BIN5_9POAL|nr:hypothetical protein HU200_033335 [Digitaria exilis]
MVSYGCVFVANGDDTLGPDLRRAVFGRALPELFALPFESKKRAYEEGYSSQINGMTHEIICIYKPDNSGTTSETMVSFAKNMLKLFEMLQTLVLEGLGVRAESVRGHLDQLDHTFRLAHYYGAQPDTETGMVDTYGRLPACYHRVRTPSNRERISVQFGVLAKPAMEVRALDDLVDVERPLAFNPLKDEECSTWRYSVEGFKFDDALKKFCGVENVPAMG